MRVCAAIDPVLILSTKPGEGKFHPIANAIIQTRSCLKSFLTTPPCTTLSAWGIPRAPDSLYFDHPFLSYAYVYKHPLATWTHLPNKKVTLIRLDLNPGLKSMWSVAWNLRPWFTKLPDDRGDSGVKWQIIENSNTTHNLWSDEGARHGIRMMATQGRGSHAPGRSCSGWPCGAHA